MDKYILAFYLPLDKLKILLFPHPWLNSFANWVILHAFLSSADFFQNKLIRKNLSGIPLECQTVWICIRPDILSGLIWVQTVCKGYQQMTPVGKELTLKTKGIFHNDAFNKVRITLVNVYVDLLVFTHIAGTS